jgi:phenylacetate-CoA ligase
MNVHENFSRNIYWPIVQKVKGENVKNALSELSESQWYSQDQLFTQQWQMVRRTVNKAAKEVPFYRKAFKSIGWDFSNLNFSFEDFLKIPIVEKEKIRDNLSEFLNFKYKGRITYGSTSGSTGQSLNLYYTGEHESYSEAARWRGKGWWDIYPGSPQVAMWGRFHSGYKDRLLQNVKSYLMNTMLFSAFDLRKNKLKEVWSKIKRFNPQIIYGYPSAIYNLAEFLKCNGVSKKNFELKVIMITAESSTLYQRALIEEVFGCPVVNEYGCSETGGFVYECPYGSWHISCEVTFIEFLNNEGAPVSAGEKGGIYLTHLRNDYMPLIRYRVGDIGSPVERICECGRGLPLMEVSVAKESDIIRSANGETYMSGDFLYINKAVMESYPSSILQYRVTQKTLDFFEIEIVPGTEKVDKAEQLFAHLMKKQIGKNIHINYKRVTKIERETSGKLRYFISELSENN